MTWLNVKTRTVIRTTSELGNKLRICSGTTKCVKGVAIKRGTQKRRGARHLKQWLEKPLQIISLTPVEAKAQLSFWEISVCFPLPK